MLRNPDAWRAALRVFEHAYGRAPEQVEPVVGLPEDALAIQAMGWRETQVLAMRLIEDLPGAEHELAPVDGSTTTTELARTTG